MLRWPREECRALWERGASLILEGPSDFDRESLEPLLAPVLDELSAIGDEEAEAVGRFAKAWDEGRLSPSVLLPGLGKEGGATRDRNSGNPE